jgi:hypothetical protein
MINQWTIMLTRQRGKYRYYCHVLICRHRDGRTSHILIDRDVFEYLLKLNSRWSINKGGYAYLPKHGYLHHIVMGIRSNPDLVCDHINRNKLDNRAANLRFCSKTINGMNQLRASNILGCTGVYKVRDRYVVRLCGRYIGSFGNLEHAKNIRKQEEDKIIEQELNGLSSNTSSKSISISSITQLIEAGNSSSDESGWDEGSVGTSRAIQTISRYPGRPSSAP